ncbi:hypothetical protein ACIQVT_21240 [Streptomyces sp. NPDC100445]|uniref:hypothetical protein n=1 Tax=Streptomyces sp. NPDC100445 TaxID=3366102 RepID=UPI00381CA5F8
MRHETTRPETPAPKLSAGLVPACLMWAAVTASAPWLPSAAHILDLTGAALMLSMLVCGPVPSALLGATLGRAGACRLLAVCGALGPLLWITDFTALAAPDVHAPDVTTVVLATALAVLFVSAPLLGGALAGWTRTGPRAAR